MGLSNKGPITPYHGSWADQEFKRRRAEIMAGDRLTAMQEAFEAAEISGVKAMNPTKEPVDGCGERREPGSDRQRRASVKLTQARAKLDKDSFALLQAVLGERLFINQVAEAKGWHPNTVSTSC